MDFRHDDVPMRVVGQRPGTATQTITAIRSGGDDPNLYLNLLTFGYSEVFVELNGLTMNDAVDCSSHLEISCFIVNSIIPEFLTRFPGSQPTEIP
jgi:hypothetical protein